MRVKRFGEFITEMAIFHKIGKHLISDEGLPLKTLQTKGLDANLTVFFQKEQTFLFPAGKFFVYFHQDGWKKLYDDGKAGILIFNPARGTISQYGSSPITDIWKKSYGKNIENSDMIWGVAEGIVEQGYTFVEMMSVRPGYKRNSINRKMIDQLESEFTEPIVWDEPTEDGLKFIKSFHGNKAKFFYRQDNRSRPRNWSKLYPDGEDRLIKPWEK